MNARRKEIFKYIIGLINDKKLQEGDKIPTENELAIMFNTNRMNAHFAIKALESEGIVKSNKKQGTTVIKKWTDEGSLNKALSSGAGTVKIFASPSKATGIHWSENSVLSLESILNGRGCRVIHTDMPEDTESFRAELEKKNHELKAVVLFQEAKDLNIIMQSLDSLEKLPCPVILFSRGESALEEFPFHMLALNPYREGVLASDYASDPANAFEKIIFLAPDTIRNSYWCSKRVEGFRQGASKHGFPFECPEGNILEISRQALKSIKSGSEKHLIVLANDKKAAFFIELADKEKLEAGKDFYTLSFDNNPLYRNRNLSTIAPPLEETGKLLADMIFSIPPRKHGVQYIVKADSRLIKRTT